MQAVEHWKIVIHRYCDAEVAVFAWKAPGSRTISSRTSWGDGTFSPVYIDCNLQSLSFVEWLVSTFKRSTVEFERLA